MEILEDNNKSLILIKNPESQNCIKYINVIHYHICKLIDIGELEIKRIPSLSMLTNELTKTLHFKGIEKNGISFKRKKA